jgi:hypothetical protein
MPNVRINDETKTILDEIKAPGQSYDGIISQISELWKDLKDNKNTRVEKVKTAK